MGSINPEDEANKELNDSGYVQDETPKLAPEVEEYRGAAGLLDLSDDVLLIILRTCSPQDLKSLGFSCPRLGALVLDRSLWSSVDATAVPLGRRRVRWLLQRALGPHTRELRLRGYADQAEGCLGYMNSYNLPETSDEVSSAITSLGAEERYLCGGPRIYRLTQTLPRYGGSPVPAPSGCPGPQLTLTHTALREMALRCTNMTTLELDYCVIDCRTTNIGMFPKTLKKLSLRGTKCFNLESRSFLFKIQDHLLDLEELDVSYCDWIEPACMLPLSKVPRLRALFMRDCYKLSEFVAYASLATRYGFKELQNLDLRGSPVGDSEVSAMGWLPALQDLRLAPAPDLSRPRDHAHYSKDPLPNHKELEEWEEKEPDYFIPPSISEADWIRDEEDVRGNRSMYYSNCDDPTSCILLERMVAEPVSPGEYAQVYHQFLSGHNSNVQLANPEQYRATYRRFMLRPTHGHPPAGYSLFIRRPDDDTFEEPGPSTKQPNKGTSTEDNAQPGPSGSARPSGFGVVCSCGPLHTAGLLGSARASDSAGPSGSAAASSSDEPSGTAGPSDSSATSIAGTSDSVGILAPVSILLPGEHSSSDGPSTSAGPSSSAGLLKPAEASCSSDASNSAGASGSAEPMECSGPSGSDTPKKCDEQKGSDKPSGESKTSEKSSGSDKAMDSAGPSWFGGPTKKRDSDGPDDSGPPTKRPCTQTEVTAPREEQSDEQRFREYYESMRHPRRVFEITINEMNKRRARRALNGNGDPDDPDDDDSSDDEDNDSDENGDGKPAASSEGESDEPVPAKKAKKTAGKEAGKPAKKPASASKKPVAPAGKVPAPPAGNLPAPTAGKKLAAPAGSKPAAPAGNDPAPPADKIPAAPASIKPVAPAGKKSTVPPGSKPVAPAGKKFAVPAGSKPMAPAGKKPAVPAGSKPIIPAGSKPEALSGKKPAVPAGSKPIVPAGKPVVPTGSKSVPPAGQSSALPAGNRAAPRDAAATAVDPGAAAPPAGEGEVPRVYQFRQYRRPIVIEEYINVADPDAPGVLPRGVLFPGSPTRLDHSALISDSSIRRFGRAAGENINYIQIGGLGVEGNARPDRASLRFLSVTGYRHVTDASLLHLATAAPLLERVDFTGTSVTAAGVKRFRGMRPGVEVIFSENID